MQEYDKAGRSALLVKSAKDQRYAHAHVVAHTGERRKCVAVTNLSELDSRVAEADVVALDESQFFADLYDFAPTWVDGGTDVLVAGLDGDFQRRRFGAVCDLVPLADSVLKLCSTCFNCGADAPFSLRIAARDSSLVELPGGSEMYKAACRRCFLHFETQQQQLQKEAVAAPAVEHSQSHTTDATCAAERSTSCAYAFGAYNYASVVA